MASLYIDSADRDDVTRLLSTGLFAGVTTNPAILEKAGLGTADVPEVVEWAVDAGAERVFTQVWGGSAAHLVERGRRWRELSSRVVIKIAYSPAGLEAARVLSEEGEVLITGVHQATQVIPVLATRATYVAPFLARMDAAERNGLQEAISIQRAIDGAGSALQVIAGSVRTPEQILSLIEAGIQNITFGPAVWDLFFTDEVTKAAVANFERLASAQPVTA